MTSGPPLNQTLPPSLSRRATLLAINLLYLMVWGFAGVEKITQGKPGWFDEKFRGTFLLEFPGLTLAFWSVAATELLGLVLAVLSIISLEFLERRPLRWLTATCVWSLFIFLQLGFGQWLTSDYGGAYQHFTYFAGTLVALHVVNGGEQRPRH